MTISKLQGTPYHITRLKMDENDKKRTKQSCKYYNHRTKCCKNTKSRYYDIECGYVSRCPVYAERMYGEKVAYRAKAGGDRFSYVGKSSHSEISDSIRAKRRVLKNGNLIIKDDIVKVEDIDSGEVKLYKIISNGKPSKVPVIPDLCLNKKIGDKFSYKNKRYRILSLSLIHI